MLVGLSAGSINGILLSPISVIKYHGWGSDVKETFYSAAHDLLRKGGATVFFKGVTVSIMRDATFGIIYELLRGYLRNSIRGHNGSDVSLASLFAADVLGALVACSVSSPFNYARNIIYSTAPEIRPPSISCCLKNLYQEAAAHARPVRFLESKLYIGWGTTRVALGMGLGQLVYEHAKQLLILIHE
jgi:hypothetical protein